VLAADIVSPIDVPSHDNSAMDGYAFNGAALATSETTVNLTIAGKALAGHPFPGHVDTTQCVRVMTGACMPAGCDTVVPQELVERGADSASIHFAANAVRAGSNRRLAGEDLARGHAALRAGRIMRASTSVCWLRSALAKSTCGDACASHFFSTGDELRSLGEPLDPGSVYDSNRYTLFAMLRRLNMDTLDLGVVRDEPAALEAALRSAAASADVVLTSGGVSVGEADFTKQLLQTFGDVAFWSLAMRPGRPLAFGRVWSGEHPGLGLPALILWLTGQSSGRDGDVLPDRARSAAADVRRNAAGLPVCAPPAARPSANGPAAPSTSAASPGRMRTANGMSRQPASQSSGVLSSMSEANCFIVLGHDEADIAEGEHVDIMLFDGLI
jgi:Molybdopterin biosynthesis enzyme